MADLALARKVLETEAAAILALVARLDGPFQKAVELLRGCRGRVILTGMGKSGIIARKIAATLSSTGTPAFYLHPADAIHGDVGAVQSDDVVVALSYSGGTDEILRLLEAVRRIGTKILALSGVPGSELARMADVALDCSVAEDAGPLNLVPTASTTAALALGDALAMALVVEKGFRLGDLANVHPGGSLGKRLIRVENLMHIGSDCPVVEVASGMRDVIYEMTRKALGMTCVVNAGGDLLGVITDGDLRRHLDGSPDLRDLRAEQVMTRSPVTIAPDMLAIEALNLMESKKITSLVVVEPPSKRVAGVVHMHDLLRAEMT